MSDAFTADGGDLDIQAAEYVIGTLDPQERSDFARRMAAEPAARDAVNRWQVRCADLDGAIDPAALPPSIWDAIERRLRGDNFKVIDGGRLDMTTIPDLRGSRNRWRVGALLSGAVAAALAVVMVKGELGRMQPVPPGDIYVAAVNRAGDKPALIVRVDIANRTIIVRPVAAEAPAGKSLELWYIDAGQKPKSMGVLDQDTETLTMPDEAKGGAATFAVSVEPTGGSKTGAPTGPVVYSGQLVKE